MLAKWQAGATLTFLLVAGLANAQEPRAPIAIDVASVKPSDPAGCGEYPMIDNPPGRLNMQCVTVKLLVQMAYGVNGYQVSGGPGWIGSTRYDIVAKAVGYEVGDKFGGTNESTLTDGQRKSRGELMGGMLLTLLAERFQLKAHRETKDLPVYVLAVAKGGSKLKDGGLASDVSGGLRLGRGFLAGTQETVPFLVRALSQILGRPVVDRTDLKGKYDFELKWTPDQSSGNNALGEPQGPSLAVAGSGALAADPNSVTIFTAIQEQLGLRLDSTKGPVEVVAIDRVEKASAN